jgi:hypothetical protein
MGGFFMPTAYLGSGSDLQFGLLCVPPEIV